MNINWDKVSIEFSKLKCPKDIDKPKINELKENTYYICMSERKRGKTTNWLLVGLVLNKLYGIVPQLVRQNVEMTTKSIMSDCMAVINEYGYPLKLTNKKWNHIYYDYMSKRFIYANIIDGKIVEKDEKTIIKVLSIDRSYEYKSGYNAPLGDLIIYDEFISKKINQNEIENFFHLISTVFRNRDNCKIVMIANTIAKNNPYFENLSIRRTIQNMNQGDCARITTKKGTKLYVEILGKKQDSKTKLINRLYFGFDSPSVESITGDTLWEYYDLPRIPKKECQEKIIDRSFSLKIFENEYVAINITEKFNIYVNKIINPKNIILTNVRGNKREIYGLYNKNFENFIINSIKQNRIFYSSMEVCNDFMSYVNNALNYEWY